MMTRGAQAVVVVHWAGRRRFGPAGCRSPTGRLYYPGTGSLTEPVLAASDAPPAGPDHWRDELRLD